MKPTRIVIAGGGTGGHLFPGIAVARELLQRDPDVRITFAGTARGIESRVLPREGFELDLLRSGRIWSSASAVTAPARSSCVRRCVASRRCCSNRTPCPE